MVRKVGISIDEELHEEAKKYASETGRTFSGLVEVSVRDKLRGEQVEQSP